MKIKTITCHDVYNVGASLQAYALAKYLQNLGHDVEIIDYKPDYLSNHYRLFGVNNPKYDKPFVREAYQIAKLPGRIKSRLSKRKAEFDKFAKQYLPITEQRYSSNEELKENPPIADVYFAGSDQIWNTLFSNGKDPAFYLEFAPENSITASYAASFATEDILEECKETVSDLLSRLKFLSVRESSGIDIISQLGISKKVVQVLDPVFLLDENEWVEIESNLNISEKYLLVYDFDRSSSVSKFAKSIAKKNGWKIYSIFPCDYCNRCFNHVGPNAFIYLIRNSEFVISNSFHATAFSLIFHKQFTVFNRAEKINTRMRDLLLCFGISEYLNIDNEFDVNHKKIDFHKIDMIKKNKVDESKSYINRVLSGVLL